MKSTFKMPAIALSALTMAFSAMAATQAPKPTATEAPKAHTGVEPRSGVAKELIDINSATQEQLETLPGLGKAYSMRIIAGRPYGSTSDLTGRKILPRSVYSRIKKQIVARP